MQRLAAGWLAAAAVAVSTAERGPAVQPGVLLVRGDGVARGEGRGAGCACSVQLAAPALLIVYCLTATRASCTVVLRCRH